MNSRFKNDLRKSALPMTVVAFSWLLPHKLRAADPAIIDVRRNIQLSDKDPVYRDYYISAGPETGLKPQLVVKVVRRMPMRDSTGTQAFGEMNVEVGQLRIIFVQDNMAVAREYELFSRDELPMLEQTGIMIGDRIETKGSFIDSKRKSAKKARREEKAPAVTETAEVSASNNEESPATTDAKAPAGERDESADAQSVGTQAGAEHQ